jgi:hypothetical protein
MDYIRELDSNSGIQQGLEIESNHPHDQLASEAPSTAIFDFDNGVMNSRIYTRILATASVRNNVASLTITLVPRYDSADGPLAATNQRRDTFVTSGVETFEPKTNPPDDEYRPPTSSLQDLQLRPRKGSVDEVSRSSQLSSPSLGSKGSPILQP